MDSRPISANKRNHTMNGNIHILAIIPARSGSRRLPGKNIRMLGDKHLIQHIISTAQRSHLISKTIVSTDCENIRKIAVQAGAEAPFLRPKALANDTAASIDVLRHAVQALEAHNFTHVVLLQPTSPLTRASTIDTCITKLIDENRDIVISVRKVHIGSRYIGTLDDNGSFTRRFLDHPQEIEYVPSGNVYAMTTQHLMSSSSLQRGNMGAVAVPREEALDIDYEDEFLLAEILYSQKCNLT